MKITEHGKEEFPSNTGPKGRSKYADLFDRVRTMAPEKVLRIEADPKDCRLMQSALSNARYHRRGSLRGVDLRTAIREGVLYVLRLPDKEPKP